MSESDGLICAYRLDDAARRQCLDWSGVKEAWPGAGVLWVHQDFNADEAQHWLKEESKLDPIVIGALLADETRPRAEIFGRGSLINLRGVNLNPGADPDDMVSVRLWIDGRRVVSVRLRRLMAIQDLREEIEAGRGPQSTEAFLDSLVRYLTNRMGPVVESMEDRLADAEDAILQVRSFEMRSVLAVIRQQAIGLRRYIGPQREALTRLVTIEADWLTEFARRHLRESADRVTRIVEDLDAIRERSAVVRDELSNRLSDSMNRRVYALSVIAGLFLPLGLISGLLGINVGGMPGADAPWAFGAV
jgi:zinc transporter